jgi:hypothetical protein
MKSVALDSRENLKYSTRKSIQKKCSTIFLQLYEKVIFLKIWEIDGKIISKRVKKFGG